MNFRIRSLDENQFSSLFGLSDPELEEVGAVKMTVDQFPGFPCRVSLADAGLGEEVILLAYQHHRTNSPYRASGPIFVRKTAKAVVPELNEIPKMFDHRLLSLRGYDENGMMKKALVTEGNALREKILQIFENEEVNYIHIHNAGPGCFNCLVEKV